MILPMVESSSFRSSSLFSRRVKIEQRIFDTNIFIYSNIFQYEFDILPDQGYTSLPKLDKIKSGEMVLK